MLEKELKNSIENINNGKKELLEINKELLEQNTIMTKARLTEIIENINNNDNENELEMLLEEKNKLEEELEKFEKDIEKENKEIESIGKELEIKNSKYKTVYEVISIFDNKINESDSNKEYYLNIKKLLESTVNLDKLENFTTTRNNTFLKKNYDNLGKELQASIAKDKKYVYPSCFQLKKNIKAILKTMRPSLKEEDLNKYSKIFSSYLLLHLSKINIKSEGIYIYYFLQNIYKSECFEIDQQFNFNERLISILEKKLIK